MYLEMLFSRYGRDITCKTKIFWNRSHLAHIRLIRTFQESLPWLAYKITISEKSNGPTKKKNHPFCLLNLIW